MKNNQKNIPGRPRIHEVGKWSSVQFRVPTALRLALFALLEKRNKQLAYRLSLNSLLLELIEIGMQDNVIVETSSKEEPSLESDSKHIVKE